MFFISIILILPDGKLKNKHVCFYLLDIKLFIVLFKGNNTMLSNTNIICYKKCTYRLTELSILYK